MEVERSLPGAFGQGIVISGKQDHGNNLGAKLSAEKVRLISLPGMGWWLRNEPFSPTYAHRILALHGRGKP